MQIKRDEISIQRGESDKRKKNVKLQTNVIIEQQTSDLILKHLNS